MLTAQVILIIFGAVFFMVAMAGSGDYVQFKVPSLRTWARIIIGIAGCAMLALAFTPLINTGSQPGASSPASSSSPSPATSATSAPPSTDTPYATLKSPTNNALVSRSQGFTATGKAAALGPSTIWILDFDGGYTVDQEAVVSSGNWSATDKPLGDSSDHLPYFLTMRAVVANPQCAGILAAVSSTSDDYIQNLPAGCKVIGQVTVKVSQP
jgi:hypothetical protein